MYNYKNSKSNIINVLTSKTKVETRKTVPKDQDFTFENGIRSWITAIFVDLRNSSKLFKSGNDEKIARIIRAFSSEIITILQEDENYRQIGIRGDCVYGIYSTPSREEIKNIFTHAYTVNTFMRMFNKLLVNEGYEELRAGIGLGCANDLIVKVGRSGTGINDKVWIGDAVVDASNLSSKANKNNVDAIAMSSCFYNNIYEQLVKENENYKSWIKEYKSNYYGTTEFYHCDIVHLNFNKWIDNGLKDMEG